MTAFRPARHVAVIIGLVLALTTGAVGQQGAARGDPVAALNAFDVANKLADAGNSAGARQALQEFMNQVDANLGDATMRLNSSKRIYESCRDENVRLHEAVGRIAQVRQATLEAREVALNNLAQIKTQVRLSGKQINDLRAIIDGALRKRDASAQRADLVRVLNVMNESGQISGVRAPAAPKSQNAFDKFLAGLFGVVEQKLDVRPELQMLRRMLDELNRKVVDQHAIERNAGIHLGQNFAYLILADDVEEMNQRTKATMQILIGEQAFWRDIKNRWTGDVDDMEGFIDFIEVKAQVSVLPDGSAAMWLGKRVTLRNALTNLSTEVAAHSPQVIDGTDCAFSTLTHRKIEAIGRCEVNSTIPYYRITDPVSCAIKYTNPPGCPPKVHKPGRPTPDARKRSEKAWSFGTRKTGMNYVGMRRCVDDSFFYYGKKQNADQCAAACQADLSCKFWTYNERNGVIPAWSHECWGGPLLKTPRTQPWPGFVSGSLCFSHEAALLVCSPQPPIKR